MAFAAVISLRLTVYHLLSSSDLWIIPRYRVISEIAKQVEAIGNVLEKLDGSSKSRSRKKLNALDDQIREAASKLEDKIESYLSDRILCQSEEHENETRFVIDMQYLKQDLQSFTTRMKEMEHKYLYELDNSSPAEEDEDGDAAASSFIDRGGGTKSKVIRLSNEFTKLKGLLTSQTNSKIRAISIFGMAGIGKTTLANEIFQDPYISEHFSHRVWVTVGTNRQLEEIQRDIISQVNPDMKIEERYKRIRSSQEITDDFFVESLEDKRYLIVLDDIWDNDIWVHLKRLLGKQTNGSVFLLMTRLHAGFDDPDGRCTPVINMRLLNEAESWDLLRERVFGEEWCPPQLEKAGMKIANKCAGLPLTIVTVANLLSKAQMTPEYWNEVAEKETSIFTDAYDEISKVLYPSYKYLPQYLKGCFLYMGVFPENYAIPRSKLSSMWFAEQLLRLYWTTVEDCALLYLQQLLHNSVVMINQYSSLESLSTRIKTCSLHPSFWQFCKREARKNMFFHVLNTLEDCAADGMKSQRRLCVRNNTLFGIRGVYDSVEDGCARTARSLLFYGPYHQYQLPIRFGLRLLRVLDAVNIRFYEFPIQVLKLVLLRYCALTFNGNLPASISNLRIVQYLIVHRHLSIKSFKNPSYLPVEIWTMKELKHLQVVGSDLPEPSCDTLLRNLHTLLGVTARSCTKGILGRIPNLQKLGIQIDLAPDANEPLCWFNHISRFRELKSIKCVIVNPESKVVAPPPLVSVFPWGLKKLTLSGLGYPWEMMGKIDSLINLEVLKLQCYAFRGPRWEIKGRKFLKLSSLIIEDTDLVQWELRSESVPSLVNLSLKHCYKLEEIRWEHDKFMVPNIRIVDCNPLIVACMKQIIEAASGKGCFIPSLNVHCSWSDGDLSS